MSSLDDAIQLIRQGQKKEARKTLELILRSEPGNIPAWFWSVETYSNPETRIQVLETCLKMNPGNSQVIQALQKLRSQRPPQTSFSPPPAQQPSQSYPAPPRDEPRKSVVPSYEPIYYDDKPKSSSSTHPYFDDEPPVESDSYSYPSSTQKKDTITYSDTFSLTKPKPVRKSYTFYEVWTTVLLMKGGNAYDDILDDPEAGSGRAFEWMAYAGIISGLFFPFVFISNPQFAELKAMPEFNQLFGSLETVTASVILALVMAVLTPIFSVISLAISAWFQNLIAAFMGGSGDFRRTVYALAAYMAPVGILGSVLMVVPIVGQCFASVAGIYSLILNVRALQAAHSMTTGKALGVIFLPGIFMMVFACLLILIVGMPGLSGQ